MHQQYSFGATLQASQRINWQVDDIIGGEHRLDFSRRFMPESLARVEELRFLSTDEKRILNQIRGYGYLYMFGLVEEFILPYVLDHARMDLDKDDLRTRAYLQFASEEAKHIHLFKRFREAFDAGFGTPCAVIGTPQEIAKVVLSHDRLSVALLVLHIEWMVQAHYVGSVKDDARLDEHFKSLLKHHWMEEVQHAKLDTLMIMELAKDRTADEIATAIEGYLALGGIFDGAVLQQTKFDMETFMQVTGRKLNEAEQGQFMQVQHQAQRWTFIGSGISHPNFLATVRDIAPGAEQKLAEVAPAFA
ncbi:MAG TPA: hypothetical protein VG742_11425 [Dongiaceae bacterium]|nr:hypothetical protein [Dongiaceae bacterium]